MWWLSEIRIFYIFIRDIWRGLGPRGADSTLRPPKAADETPHFGAEGAEILKKQCFWPQKRHFRAKKGKNWPFFEKFWP